MAEDFLVYFSELSWSSLHFIRPEWLWTLLPLFVLSLWRWRAKRRSGSWGDYCDAELLPYLLTESSLAERRWPAITLYWIALLTIVALAGPSWQKVPQPLFRDNSSLVILLDLSRSMDSADQKPSRLIRARLKIQDILKLRSEGQTGLVVFAGSAFVVTPLTTDNATIISLINSLDTAMMPVQGSQPDKAIERGIALMQQAGSAHGELLLLTDGVSRSTLGLQMEAAAKVVDAGYRLSIIALGTVDGAPIPLQEGGYLKSDRGEIVIPRLDSEPLQEMANRGGGDFSLLQVDEGDIELILKRLQGASDQTVSKEIEQQQEQWREEGPWLLFLIIPLLALFYRRGYWAIGLFFILPQPQPVYALDWSQTTQWFEEQNLWKNKNQQALDLMQQGEPVEAAKLFDDPKWQAAATYQSGDYARATELYQQLEGIEARYNLGNALAKGKQYPEAIAAYESVLKDAPGHLDAAHNLDELKKLLEQQQPPSPPEESEQDSSEGSNGESEEDKSGSEEDKDGSEDQGDGQSEAGESGKEGSGSDQSSAEDTPHQQGSGERQENKDESSGSSSEQDQGAQESATAADNSENQGTSGREEASAAAEQAIENESERGEQDESEPEPASLQAGDEEEIEDGSARSLSGVKERENEPPPQEVEPRSADEQWLRRIPDDPGGLLRRKFQYQYQLESKRTNRSEEAW